MKTFTILGTGWLGEKLAQKLKDDYKIKVSKYLRVKYFDCQTIFA